MNNDLLNILSNSNKDIDNQQLMDYLSGKLSDAEKHEIEKMMADSAFMNDAVEGLQHITDQKDMQLYVDQLNSSLQKNLKKKRKRRLERQLREGPWGYFAILLILILCIVAFLVIRRFLQIPH